MADENTYYPPNSGTAVPMPQVDNSYAALQAWEKQQNQQFAQQAKAATQAQKARMAQGFPHQNTKAPGRKGK